jgi:hypothetical protein
MQAFFQKLALSIETLSSEDIRSSTTLPDRQVLEKICIFLRNITQKLLQHIIRKLPKNPVLMTSVDYFLMFFEKCCRIPKKH